MPFSPAEYKNIPIIIRALKEDEAGQIELIGDLTNEELLYIIYPDSKTEVGSLVLSDILDNISLKARACLIQGLCILNLELSNQNLSNTVDKISPDLGLSLDLKSDTKDQKSVISGKTRILDKMIVAYACAPDFQI